MNITSYLSAICLVFVTFPITYKQANDSKRFDFIF